ALRDLEAFAATVLADADSPGAAYDLPRHEERNEMAHDVGERRGALHEVILVAAVGRALVVDVVLVQLDRRRARHAARPPGRRGHDALAGLVPHHRITRRGHLG